MSQSFIMVRHPIDQSKSSNISDEVPAQIECSNHVSISQKLAQFNHMLICQLLVFDLNDYWHCDSPTLNRRGEVFVYGSCFLKRNLRVSCLLITVRLGLSTRTFQ